MRRRKKETVKPRGKKRRRKKETVKIVKRLCKHMIFGEAIKKQFSAVVH